MLKKLVALCLALLMLFGFAACGKQPTETPEEEEKPPVWDDDTPGTVESGKIGDSEITWALYTDGTLYIRGTGDMPEMETNSGNSTRQPWFDYIANGESVTIKSVVVEDGITSLAQGAFQGCVNLESANIPNAISVIPYKCFAQCGMLKTVYAKGVIHIEMDAFSNCKNLTLVTLSASLEMVEEGAFYEVATKSQSFSVRLAGDAAERAAALEKIAGDPELGIWTGNSVLEAALPNALYVSK